MKNHDVLLLVSPVPQNRMLGISRFAKAHRWSVTIGERSAPPTEWRGDGVLVMLRDDPTLVRFVKSLVRRGIPVVDLSAFRPDIPLPSVTGDNVGIGRMAADFLLKKGFTRAAYFSTQFHRLQKLHLHGFADQWKRATGNKVVPIVPKLDKRRTGADDWTALGFYIRSKLAGISKPLAVFAYCDYDAAKVETAALEAGLHVPKDVAILGVDNDPLVCENDVVPISSICHNLTQ